METREKTRGKLYLVFLVVFLLVFSVLILVFTRKVTGVSMVPTLEQGDLVAMINVPIDQVHVGDIVIFNDPTQSGCSDFTIIHRVVAISPEGGLITQGDDRATNPVADEPPGGPYVTQQCLVGRVVFVVPYLERLAEVFPYPVNYILAILIVIFVVFSEFRPTRGPKPELSKPSTT